MERTIHIIDSDATRRAKLASDAYRLDLHAEIYSSFGEFNVYAPAIGVIFAYDDTHEDILAIGKFKSCDPRSLPIILYREKPNLKRVIASVRLGIIDYLEWPLQKIDIEEIFIDKYKNYEKAMSLRKITFESHKLINGLTGREKDVLNLLYAGKSNKEIGQHIGISPRTVEVHRGNMMKKLRTRNIAETIKVVLRAGMGNI